VNGLDRLVKMPYGCGEQNMLNFAPNIYIMKYLETANQLTADISDKAQRYMLAGRLRRVELLIKLHLRATGCHWPHVISQCYLSPNTSELILP